MRRVVHSSAVLASLVPLDGTIVGPDVERAEEYRSALRLYLDGELPWAAVAAASRGRMDIWEWAG